MDNLLIIGKIGSVHGILGWNKIFSYTEKKKEILKYQPWYIKQNNTWTKHFLECKKVYNTKIIVKLKNINDRNTAKILTNSMIAIQKKQLPKLTEYEYYWHHIVQCKVFNKKNIYIGLVIKIIRTKKNDILVIQKPSIKNQEILIPFIEKIFIKKININMQTILLNI
ncbi:ribosome maturation factor RimM [Buchnera aphidicola]|uniref:Ribosome maturation factor RimM n=1 Tax=Buchnera aphidicola (Sarucallis kahawaluokalani) TaxID=1241878 RepID=A0A4D6YK41_9GAMM|nr:ribosome maturation factor RimM [Buchnera aphidicola]QCI26058.1 ribosome maturation factor RimM [Buchnera aphidicola (Sarucallis kahawaluokalani)]